MGRTSDLSVVRDLAKRYMEIAVSEKHQKMRRRFRASNDLKIVRPPVIIEEIPWEQMNLDHALDCVCEDEELRKMEYFFRVALFREKYFRCDNYIEPYWVVNKAFSSTGNGLPTVQERFLKQHNTDIQSHSYEDVLEDEHSLDSFHLPVITAYPDEDRKNVARAQELIGDILPVQLRGQSIYYAPWDVIPRLRGVEPILIDMVERPEYLHRIIGLFTEAKRAEMDQMEALGLYDPRGLSIHCTPAEFTPKDGAEWTDDSCFGLKDMWFRTMAQMFNMISPAQHDEFDIQYSLPLSERCAYTYYGCCEPLSDRLDILKQYRNLRKIGCSPWADVERMAEEIGGSYVLSRKPNPANVAMRTDPEVIRREIEQTAKACLKNGTPCDITLKDISTVGDRPENLIVWAQTVSEVLDVYYGND